MKQKKIYTAKSYRLVRKTAPLSYILSSHNTARSPLLYFDEEKGINRPLRYAKNQQSPFEDEQDGNAILEPVIFDEGLLHVQKQNQVLQEFLYYHPGRDKIFEEINNQRDADRELEIITRKVDAVVVASEMDIEKMVSVGRILIGSKVDKMTTSELKRDIFVIANNNPEEFLDVVNDPDLEYYDTIRQFFDKKLLSFRKKKKEVWFNLPSNKTKMLSIPFGMDPYEVVGDHLKLDDNIDVYLGLKDMLNK